MGGGKKSKAPPAPNYAAIAAQDAAAQKETANLITQQNRPTQKDALGNSMNWTKDAEGNWTQTEVWDPRVTQGYDNAFGLRDKAMQGAIGAEFKGPAQVADYQNKAGGVSDFVNAAGALGNFTNTAGSIADYKNTSGPVAQFDPNSGKAASDAMYASYMSRAGKEQGDQQQAMQTQLRQQGLQPGTEAYDRAYKNLLTSHGDVNAKANLDSIVLGGNEARNNYASVLGGQQQSWNQGQGDYQASLAGQGQRFNQSLAGSQQNQSLQGQRFDQGLSGYQANLAGQNQRYQQGIGDYSAKMQGQDQKYRQADADFTRKWDTAGAAQNLLNTQYRPSYQGFSGATGYNPADMMGASQAQYAAKMGGYNSQQAKKGNTMNTAGQLGAAGMMAFSDAALKHDIRPLVGRDALEALLQLGGYTWRWNDDGSKDMGVIAQEVQRILPELVAKSEAHLMVNYTGLVALAIESIKYLAGELSCTQK
jgi:hypothetical protein